jgi:VWFA-related protein
MRQANDSAKLLLCLLILTSAAAAQRVEPRDGGAGRRAIPEPMRPVVTDPRGVTVLSRAPRYPRIDKRTVTFKSRSELVLVPVVVRDKYGRHISGLGREQFRVFEDGKPLRLTQFEEIKSATATLVQKPLVPEGVYTNLVTPDQSPRQVAIIMLDMLNTPLADQARARDELLKYLARSVNANTPTSLLVLSHKGVRVLHDFAVEPRVLAAALSKAASQNPDTHLPPPSSQMSLNDAVLQMADPRLISEAIDAASARPGTLFRQANAIAATMEAFQHIAQSFAGVPGRKALIWATASFPFTVMEDTGIVGQGQPSSLYERTMQMLANANIAVYPVDVRGLVVFGGAGDYDEATHPQTIGTMEMFAQMTGGRAFYNRNNLHRAFEEATEESNAYYLLGYQLDTDNTKAGWRQLKVEVDQPGARVRARTGFFVTPVTEDPAYSRQVDIWNALQSPLDYTSLNFVVQWTQISEKGDRIRAEFEIAMAANAVAIDTESGNRIELEFLGVARDSQGEAKGDFSKTFEAKLKPEAVQQIRESGITYKGAMELPKGHYKVRFVVRDNNSGKTGSVQAQLTENMAAAK